MESGWLEDNARSVIMVACLVLGIALAVSGIRLAGVLLVYVAGMIVFLSVTDPSSAWALQEDGRARERRRLSNLFRECLDADGISEGVEFACHNSEPPTFMVTANRYGMTEDRIRIMCNLSLPAFNAIRYTCETTETDNGTIGYKISFHRLGETETLERLEVRYEDIESVEPSFDRIPIGMFDDGSIAFMSFDNRNALIGGLPRSGKSVLLSTLIAGLSRCEYERIVILSPKSLDFQMFRERAELHETPEGILRALQDVSGEIERRKQYCSSMNIKKIERFNESMPHIVIVIDEYAVIRSSQTQDEKGKPRKIGVEIEQEVFRIVSQGAFSGCQVCITSQRLSSTVISTDLRDICAGNLLCFASGSKVNDEMIFGDYAAEAPAHRIPVTAKGVGYVFSEGSMPRPRLFRAALTDMATEQRVAEQNEWKKPRGSHDRKPK